MGYAFTFSEESFKSECNIIIEVYYILEELLPLEYKP